MSELPEAQQTISCMYLDVIPPMGSEHFELEVLIVGTVQTWASSAVT